ncbi:MAG: sulfatase [Planctomycetota bacterium]
MSNMSNKKLNTNMNRRQLLKYGIYGGLSATLSSSLWLSGCDSSKVKKKPNIILISVDTLRPDFLGCYGYAKDVSPNVDSFAAECVLFENCLAQAPSTAASCASFLSGFLPHETKVRNNGPPVPPGVPMIAEILKQDSYKTYGVVGNWILRKRIGFAQGFDLYSDKMDQRELVRKDHPEKIAENTTNDAIAFLKQHKQGNFFMWIHYQDPHGPYTPKSPYDKMFPIKDKKPLNLKFNSTNDGLKGIPLYQQIAEYTDYYYYLSQYDGEIRYFDEHFGRLIRTLKELGMYEDSLMMFTSDHGESIGEHNYFFVHGHNLDHCLLHVPLLIRYRGLAPGKRNEFVQLLDIVPTILEQAGIKKTNQYRGRNLLVKHSDPPIIFSEVQPSGTTFSGASVSVNGLKLLTYGEQPLLFDTNKDPAEKNNLATDVANRIKIANMSQKLVQMMQQDLLGVKAARTYHLTPEEIQKLRSLGYLD